jgi:hypothetical protein
MRHSTSVGKTEEDGENSFQDRMVKAPLKAVDLANVLKEVDRVVKETPKFTATMGEKPEKVSSRVMYNFGGGPRFAFVSASSRHAK